MVRSWLAELAENDYSARSLRRKRTSVSSLYKYLIYIGYCEVNPTKGIPLPKLPGRIPVTAPETAVLEITHQNIVDDDFVSVRNQLMFELLYATGIRVSELSSLNHSDIDYSLLQIKVNGKRNKQRIIPFGKAMIQRLHQYETIKAQSFGPSGHVDPYFVSNSGKRMYSRYVYRVVHQYLSAIPALRRRSPHVMRHSFATHLLQGGADLNVIKELLGHSSLAATQVYTHTNIRQLKEVYQKSHPKS